MKIKARTKKVFDKWCETHKQSDTFILAGEPMKGSEVKKLIYGDTEIKSAPKTAKAVNTDIQEEKHADMEPTLYIRDPEEY